MPTKVTIKQQHRGSVLKVFLFAVSDGHYSFGSESLEPIVVDDLAEVRIDTFPNFVDKSLNIMVSVKKIITAKNFMVNISISGDKFEKQLLTCFDKWSESKIIAKISSNADIKIKNSVYSPTKVYSYTQELNITVQDVTHNIQTNEGLYDDTQFTDFELCSTDGRVAVHKVVLAKHSELFQKLFSDRSKDTERQFPIQGVTVQTLQHLKNYMYLGTLPVVGLPQLLLFAIHGKMGKLKEDCISKLAAVVTGDDLDALIEFAIQHNIPKLVHAMLSMTSDSAVHSAHQNRKSKLKFCTMNLTQLALE